MTYMSTHVNRWGGWSNLIPCSAGADGDTLGTGTVLVYDTAQFPAHVAFCQDYGFWIR